jgi:Tol biopolymer transport system component
MMKCTRLTLLALLTLAAMWSTVGCGVGSSTLPATNPVFTKLMFNSSEIQAPLTNLFVMGMDGSNQTPVTLDACCVDQASISADAKTMAFFYGGNAWVKNVATGVQTQLTTAGNTYELRISPDGKKIVFNQPDPVTMAYSLWVMNVDGTSKTSLTPTLPGGVQSCRIGVFSADSAKIVMACDGGSTFGIFTVKADGTGLATVLSQSAFVDTPAFSPDGTKIVFVNYGLTGSTTYGVVSVNLDGSNQTLLVGSAQESEVLNSSVYYSAYDATVSNQRIYKCDLDGSNSVAITDGSTYDYLGLGNMI